MKFFELKKSQLLNEIMTFRGGMEGSAVGEFFDDISTYSKPKKLIKLTRKYFDSVVGYSIDELNKEKVDEYLSELSTSYPDLRRLPKILRNKDVISNLAFYLASNLLKMKDGIEVKYVKYSSAYSDATYYFFDSELEELFGYIKVDEEEIKGLRKYCKTNTINKVRSTMSDKELRGTGIGKNMYLTLIDKFGCLASDSTLYENALNIWVNVLPKYSNVYYYDNNEYEGGEIKPLDVTQLPERIDVDFFFATKK